VFRGKVTFQWSHKKELVVTRHAMRVPAAKNVCGDGYGLRNSVGLLNGVGARTGERTDA